MLSALALLSFPLPHLVPPTPSQNEIRAGVEAALVPLKKGAVGHSEQKTCFGCHNQAFPMIAFATAKGRGFDLPADLFKSQATHIASFIESNRERFADGRGTGGQVDTAGYALLTLELAGYKHDENTAAVIQFLLKTQPTRDYWRTNSNRPPTEASHFTTTYLAVRALNYWGTPAADKQKMNKRIESARAWLVKMPAKDTEDRVFRLLALKEAGAEAKEIASAAWDLLQTQRTDGGWAQLDGTRSDALATGAALVALHQVGGLKTNTPAYRSGVGYLLKTQRKDGTWFVRSRSKPFQPYYESGFPHEKNQFVSCAATGWATAALALASDPPK
ncbi:MAG: terpene cyclase/mutase family protein [Planctomycetia bacterium]|nr:terpene cyclase/mutase family protein [Planctomycetia bacterium]